VQPPDKNDPDSLTDHTVILTRKLGKETRWRKLATLSGRVVSVAACDEDAKVLLDTGDWMTIWADGEAFGPPAPGVLLIALAADHDDFLWAVGRPAPVIASTITSTAAPGTSQPMAATLPTAANPANATALAPATQPADWPRTPAIYRFDGMQWSRVIALPADLQVIDPATVSLAIIDHQPVLAVNNGADGIRVWTGENDHWSSPRDVSPPRPVTNFDILNVNPAATLWYTEGGPGALGDVAWDRPPAGEQPLGPDGAIANDPRSAARAAEAIRLFSASGDHVYEQTYGSDGSPMGSRAELMVDLEGTDSQIQNWLAPTLTVIVTMLLFGAVRRSGAGELPTGLEQANLALAPLFPRFIAGTIDALPVLLSILYVAWQMELAGMTDDMPTNTQMIPFYVGSGIYLLYTIGAELLFGNTIGKWVFGLQIVTVEGARPPRVALLVRNLLRLVDLFFLWLPLATVLFSPLRQRLGDLAAGTLVVRAAESEPPKPEA
jgi:uncharacterized RDD family membrane protein YckC